MSFINDLLNKTTLDDRVLSFINKKKGELDENIRTRLTERYGETNIKGIGADYRDEKSVFNNILSGGDTPGIGLGEPPVTEAPPAPVEEITEPEADDPYGEWKEEQRNTTEVRPDVLDFLDNKWLPLTSESKIPNQLSAAQWAIEGGRNTEIDNPAGLKRGGEVLDYGDLADNAEAYTDTVIDIAATNMGIPLEEFNIEDYDVEEILYHLQFQSNGEWGIKRYEDSLKDKDGNYDPQLYIDMVHDMPEWRYYSSL